VVNPEQQRRGDRQGHRPVPDEKEHDMTTRVLDRRDRSAQITLLASIAAGVALAAVVAFTAFGGAGGGRGNGGIVPPAASPAAPAETPSGTPAPDETPAPTPDPPTEPVPDGTPVPDETPAATPNPNDGGSDAMPIKVDLENATGDDVYVDIDDRTGLLVDAESGTPGDGMSVEPYTLKVENIDATTLKLTWVDYPIDNALALFIYESEVGIRLLLVQPEPTGPTDSIGFDRVLILEFSEAISADDVDRSMQDGLDTPG
jgi:hypothetical protein